MLVFHKVFRPALGPIQSPIQRISWTLLCRKSSWNTELTNNLHLLMRLRMYEAIFPLPYLPLWYGVYIHTGKILYNLILSHYLRTSLRNIESTVAKLHIFNLSFIQRWVVGFNSKHCTPHTAWVDPRGDMV